MCAIDHSVTIFVTPYLTWTRENSLVTRPKRNAIYQHASRCTTWHHAYPLWRVLHVPQRQVRLATSLHHMIHSHACATHTRSLPLYHSICSRAVRSNITQEPRQDEMQKPRLVCRRSCLSATLLDVLLALLRGRSRPMQCLLVDEMQYHL